MKNFTRFLFYTMLICVMAALPYCSLMNEPEKQTGTGTETENVAGILYNPGGTPAANAKLSFISTNHNPDPRETETDSIYTTHTNDSGEYTLDSVPADTFNVTAEGDSGVLFNDSVIIDPQDSSETREDTLGKPGTLHGVIGLKEGGSPLTVFILVLGTEKYTAPDSTGIFSLSDMADGTYNVRIISTLDEYLPLDTNLSVTGGKVDSLKDTLWLEYTGIPTPQNVTLSYDTMLQIVTLTWESADTNLIQGYNIYRQHEDSGLVKINSAVVTDTVYRDSSAVQDEVYTYQVKAVDMDGNEGDLSEGIIVDIIGQYSVDLQFESESVSDPTCITVKKDPDKRLYCFDGHSISVYNSTGVYIKTLNEHPPNINDIDADTSNNLYCINLAEPSITKWNSGDSLINNMQIPEFNEISYYYTPSPLITHIGDDYIYVYDRKQILTYSTNGVFINKFLLTNNQVFMAAVSIDTLLIYDSTSSMLQFYNRNWESYHEDYISMASPEKRISDKAAALNDSILIVLTNEYNNNLWNGRYLSFVNIFSGNIIAILGKQYMKYEHLGIRDFAIGPERKIYTLTGKNTIMVFKGQEH